VNEGAATSVIAVVYGSRFSAWTARCDGRGPRKDFSKRSHKRECCAAVAEPAVVREERRIAL
jgi:hypothetical protein